MIHYHSTFLTLAYILLHKHEKWVKPFFICMTFLYTIRYTKMEYINVKKYFVHRRKNIIFFCSQILFWKHFDFFSPVGKMPLASFASSQCYLLRVCNTGLIWYATYAQFHTLWNVGWKKLTFIIFILKIIFSSVNSRKIDFNIPNSNAWNKINQTRNSSQSIHKNQKIIYMAWKWIRWNHWHFFTYIFTVSLAMHFFIKTSQDKKWDKEKACRTLKSFTFKANFTWSSCVSF